MLLQESTAHKTSIIRHHFPSLVETESLYSFGPNNDIESICLVYIEGDSPRIDRKHHTSPAQGALLQPSSIDSLYNQTILRTINLHECGLSNEYSGAGRILKQAVIYNSDGAIPLVSLAAQLGYQQTSSVFSHCNEQDFLCSLYQNYRTQYVSYADLRKSKPLQSKLLPSYQGSTTCMSLTKELQPLIKSQMQWKREDTLRYGDRMKKQYLLSLSIERRAEAADDEALLEDPISKAPLLDALGHHLTIPMGKQSARFACL